MIRLFSLKTFMTRPTEENNHWTLNKTKMTTQRLNPFPTQNARINYFFRCYELSKPNRLCGSAIYRQHDPLSPAVFVDLLTTLVCLSSCSVVKFKHTC